MSFTIQEVGKERVEEFLAPVVTAMGGRLEPESAERWNLIDEYVQQLAALDDDRIVGSAGAFDFTLTVPGGSARTTGLTVVGTLASHRRRGVMRELVTRHLRDGRARGAILSALWASESQIYGRFGYGMASQIARISIEPTRSAYMMPLADRGSVRLVEIEEAAQTFPGIWEAARPHTPGMLSRSASWWLHRRLTDREKAGPVLQRARLDLDGQPAAYAIYRNKASFETTGLPVGTLQVIEAVGATAEATRCIWRYLLEIDLMDRVEATLLPIDHVLVCSLVEPRRLRMTVADGLWVRVLDVPAALAARTYATDATLTLAVTDELFPDNQGCYRIDGATGAVERVTSDPDIELDAAGLGSIYLNGFRFSHLVQAGRARERTPGAATRADTLFYHRLAPWCPEIF